MVDWEYRDFDLSAIRDEEIAEFRRRFDDLVNNYFRHSDWAGEKLGIFYPALNKIIDLGCGTDKYLKSSLGISDHYYVGVDLAEGSDVVADVRRLHEKFFEDSIVVSLGLFYLLNEADQIKLLKKINHGVIQINRYNSPAGKELIDSDRKNGIVCYPVMTRNSNLLIMDGVKEVYSTSVSYIIVKGNE